MVSYFTTIICWVVLPQCLIVYEIIDRPRNVLLTFFLFLSNFLLMFVSMVFNMLPKNIVPKLMLGTSVTFNIKTY